MIAPIGTKVRCVDMYAYEDYVTIGRVYEVVSHNSLGAAVISGDDRIFISTDHGHFVVEDMSPEQRRELNML